MNGVHDMGGMHGFGPVPDDDAAFHADWEREAYALNKLLRLQGMYNIHEYRHSVERMEPDAYLSATYFERWFAGVEQLIRENDILDEQEIQQRLAEIRRDEADVHGEIDQPDEIDQPGEIDQPDESANTDPDALPERAHEAFRTGASELTEATEAAYEAGQRVRVRNFHPAGHTRAPRYARGAVGTVTEVLGQFELPDAAAHGEDRSEPVYTVEFDAAELWGEDTDGDIVALDMWERYLTEE